MDSFPRQDLPADVAAALASAYAESPALPHPEWVKALFQPDPAAPPPPALTPEERILGLATIWSEAKYNFAFWDRLPGEDWWDRLFQAYLPRVTAAASDAEHWRLLEEFASLLQDGHTHVFLPPHLRLAVSEPPLRIRDVEGRPVVVAGEALPPGSEVLTVDGRPAADLRADRAAAIPACTPQWVAALSAARILRGPADRPATITAHLPDGSVREVTLPRSGPLPPPPGLQIHDLGDGIRHVELNTMADPKVVEAFDAAFPDFDGVTGLIIDVRANGGGSSDVGYGILARLVEAPVPTSMTRLRVYIPTYRAWGREQRWLAQPEEPIRPATGRPRLAGPVAVLSSPLSFSAAEDFLVAFRAARRGPIIGQPSGGSTGQPLVVPLPGGGAFWVCTKRDTGPQDEEFVGVGVQPDLPCAPTIAGVAAGRDEVLERAIRYIRDGE